MAIKGIFEEIFEAKKDKTLVEVTVGLSRRDKAILTVLSDHYGCDISEVVRMLLRQKVEQMPELSSSLAFAQLREKGAFADNDGAEKAPRPSHDNGEGEQEPPPF